MKKIEKLKLNQLSHSELEKREMNFLLGGSDSSCICGCVYADEGGASKADNGYTNWYSRLDSPGGGDYYGQCKNCTGVYYPDGNGGATGGSTTAEDTANTWG